jgi:hypothetical protein
MPLGPWQRYLAHRESNGTLHTYVALNKLGAQLGRAIVAYPGDIEAALLVYEEEMFREVNRPRRNRRRFQR